MRKDQLPEPSPPEPGAPPTADVVSQLRDLLGLPGSLAELSLEALQRYTRAQLLEYARRLGLTGLSRLTKAVIAEQFQAALTALGVVGVPAGPAAERGTPGDAAHKFDLGPRPEAGPPEHIPWGYGQDRVTAMAIDPERLYVYWEVTDESIARARERLGRGGPGAWLDLRVYDVSGRLFDGTNAHSYFDHRVERTDRQWFFHIDRPTATVVVELGMRSTEGYFVRITRSGRADFPRREPAPPAPVEWLTVLTASGEVGGAVAGAGPLPGGAAADAVPPWDAGGDAARAHANGGPREVEVVPGAWCAEGVTVVWEEAPVRSSWEAGPFAVPIEPPPYGEERYEGGITVRTEGNRTHVVHGPWQVVIRGLGAHAEREVLAVWEIVRSEATGAPRTRWRTLRTGASEQIVLGASERRLGGASERYRFGASELRLRGASELVLGGASERRLGGASERRLGGASERRLGGASERRVGGASERSRAVTSGR